jgi:hypothetical protein
MPVGVVSGKSTAFYLFGLHVGGQDTLSSALEDALETVPRLVADTMVNVFVDRRVIYIPSNYFPIFTRIDTVLSGTLIKYQDKNFLEMKNLKNYETPEFQNNK